MTDQDDIYLERKRRRISQKDASRELGIKAATLVDIEYKRIQITGDEVKRIVTQISKMPKAGV